MKKWLFIFLFALGFNVFAHAQGEAGDGSNIFKISDTSVKPINLLASYCWDVSVFDKQGNVKLSSTCNADTTSFAGTDSVVFKALLHIPPSEVERIFYMEFESVGNSLMTANGDTLFTTGFFVDKKKTLVAKEKKCFTVNFKDTLVKLTLVFRPSELVTSSYISVWVGGDAWRQKQAQDEKEKDLSDFRMGFYYLSFACVFFSLFVFYRKNREYLYFSLFCLFFSIANIGVYYKIPFLSSSIQIDYIRLPYFPTVFALEFFTFFLSQIVFDKQRKFRRLYLILAVTILGIILFTTNSGGVLAKSSGFLGWFYEGMMAVVLILQLGTVFRLLFSGMGQKKWEAKYIMIFFTVPFVCLFLSMMSMLFSGLSGFKPFIIQLVRISSIVVAYVSPIGVSMIMGRRYGISHTKMETQLEEIKLLSEKNMAQELERQRILENQNAELERMVDERTEIVMRQKAELELKNKSITDNVTYAKRIQDALLPTEAGIAGSMPDSFVIFLPKDIVSGDFYSFHEKGGKKIFVAGDCTGHGVSGALMSMIGSSLLNQVINERGVTDPAQILEELNLSVLNMFEGSGSESNDGMDVAVCVVDEVDRTLVYAGANRPLWYLCNGEIEVVKPNKYPIGGFQLERNRAYTNHEINFSKGDSFYIFTDGYADQFGGDANKKMMTSRMKEQIVAVHALQMSLQKNQLLAFFNQWKGSEEQVDDVLLMGVRL